MSSSRNSGIKTVAALAVIVCALAGEVWAASVSEDVHREAQRILANAKITQYSHRTDVDDKAGRYLVDCSGFVSVVLKQVAPAHLKAVPHKKTRSRPLAYEFYEAFVNATWTNGWTRVVRLEDARPGDCIAWRKAHWEPGENTGHIIIVDEIPVREADGRWRVVVLDSTGTPHAEDSRKEGASGIGRGTMWFVTDEIGKPIGLNWRDPTRKPRTPVPIAVGRAVPIRLKSQQVKVRKELSP